MQTTQINQSNYTSISKKNMGQFKRAQKTTSATHLLSLEEQIEYYFQKSDRILYFSGKY